MNQVTKSARKQAVLIVAKPGNDAAKQGADELSKWLKKQSIRPVNVSAGEEQIAIEVLRHVVVGVSFGGDGTLLSLVDRLGKKDRFPLIGVNLGTLGFITSVGRSEVQATVQKVLSGTASEDRRALFGVDVYRGRKGGGRSPVHSGVFLNDAVILKDAAASMLTLDVRVEGALLSQVRADGYILSSATGSTAYALSAGGPLVHPAAEVLLLVPICAHSLTARPVLIPASSSAEVTLVEASKGTILVFDGQRKYPLNRGDRLVTSPLRYSLRLVGGSTAQWSEALRSKLRIH